MCGSIQPVQCSVRVQAKAHTDGAAAAGRQPLLHITESKKGKKRSSERRSNKKVFFPSSPSASLLSSVRRQGRLVFKNVVGHLGGAIGLPPD